MAETPEQKAHVEKSSIQAYYLAHTKGNAMERKEYLNKLYELCERYGITHYRESTLIDFTQVGKTGSLG